MSSLPLSSSGMPLAVAKTSTTGTKRKTIVASSSSSSNSSNPLPSSFAGNKDQKTNTSFASSSVKTQKMGSGSTTSNTNTHQNTTLSSLLKYMEGYEVIVELKTGKRHQGILTSADDKTMNLTLQLTTQVPQSEQQDDQAGSLSSQTKAGYPPILPPEGKHNSPDASAIQQTWLPIDDDSLYPTTTPNIPSSSSTTTVPKVPTLSLLTTIMIRGCTIRYVQFPDNANLAAIVYSGREREQQARNKYRKTVRKSTTT